MRNIAKLLVLMFFAVTLFSGAKNASAIDINNCSVLDTAGGFYNLTNNITNSANTTCFDITANNIILDCSGHKIDGTDSLNSYGISINNYDNITIKNCEITDWGDGIYMSSSSFSRIINDTIDSNQKRGIYMPSSDNTLISKSTIKNNINYGIYLSGSANNNFSEVNVSYGISYGMLLDSSSNGNMINNSIMGYNDVNGIGIQSSSGNKIINTSIYSNDVHGVLITYSSNNNLTNCNIHSNGDQGLRITYSSDNWIKDTIINNSGGYEVYSSHDSASNNYFMNTTFNKSDVYVDQNAIIWITWYLDARVIDVNNKVMNDTYLNISDVHGTLLFSNKTNSSGYITRQILTEYNQTSSGKNYYTDYLIKVNSMGYYENSTQVNLVESILFTVYLNPLPPPGAEVKTYNLGLSESYIFKPSRIVRIRASVTSWFGKDYIENATIGIKDNTGSYVKENELMTNISEITGGYLYEYNYTLPSNAEGLWTINVASADKGGQIWFDAKKIAITSLTIGIKLVLNSTSDTIYIPSSGVGEKTFSELTTTEYSTPEHYYIASSSDDALKAVVLSQLNPVSVFTERGSDTYAFGTNQHFSNSMVFVVFSKGGWEDINNRMDSIEKDEFLSYSEPSFGFGIGKENPIKLVLVYENIDLNKTMKIGRGYNRIVVENIGKIGGRVNLEIKKT